MAPTLAPRRRSAPRHPLCLRTSESAAIGLLPEGSEHPPPHSLQAHHRPQRPQTPPPIPPGLDLPPTARRSQARATRATSPSEMHLRPPCPAACHRHGHPRGRPSAACPGRLRAGGIRQPRPPTFRAAWAAPGLTGVRGDGRGLRRRWPGIPRTPARARPRWGAPGADLEPKPQRCLAQWPLRRAPRPRSAGPAPSARAPAGRRRPSRRWPSAASALQGAL